MATQLLSRQQVLAELADQHGINITAMTLYRWQKRGLFPRPIRIAPRIVGWTPNTVGEWFKARIAAGAEAASSMPQARKPPRAMGGLRQKVFSGKTNAAEVKEIARELQVRHIRSWVPVGELAARALAALHYRECEI